MARQVISTTPHFSGLGNKAFESFEKINDNFLELYTGANIPALPAASALTGTELFPAVQSGALVKVLGSNLAGGITALTGDVTAGGSGSVAATITANAVTNAKAAQMPTLTVKGNNTGGAANPIDLTAAQVTALLNPVTASLKGLAPASGGGTTNYLRADGAWAAPAGASDPSAATYAAARLLVGISTGDRLIVLGRTTKSDGGQGLFTWVAGGSTIINDGYQLSATGGIWQRTPDQLVTPFMFGAKGDGAGGAGTDDTTAVLTAVNTGFCFLPPNYGFKVSSPVQVPRGGTLVGASPHSSALVGNGVVGGVVQIGDGGITTVHAVKVGNFRIYGTGTVGLKVDHAAIVTLDQVYLAVSDDYPGVTTAFTYGFWFDYIFNASLTNLSVFGLNLGGTATFTASVGGATSGTLTVPIVNGKHPMIFSNGNQRVVTITGGTAATWPVALTAGTVTTATYGCAFLAGGAFNANVCNYWQTSSGAAYSAYCEDINAVGTSIGNTFDALTLQASNVALYVGNGWSGCVFNGIYTEVVGQAIILGSRTNNKTCDSLTFNSPILGVVSAAAGGFGNPSNAVVRLDYCQSIVFNSPQILCYQYDQKAPVTITRGGGDTTGTGARGLCLVTPAGIVKAITLWRPGSGYTATPTVSIGGMGTGATATATFGNVCTFTGTTVSNILTVTAIASGALAIGNTLTGGGITAGTYLVAPLAVNALGIGTWVISNVGAWTPTGASAITSLNLTAGGAAYSAGYAAVSVGDIARCTIIAPHCQFDGGETPLWPMVVDSSTDHRFEGGGLEIISDFDHGYPDSSGITIPISMKRIYAWQGDNQVYSVAFDTGFGFVTYVKYTAPNYP